MRRQVLTIVAGLVAAALLAGCTGGASTQPSAAPSPSVAASPSPEPSPPEPTPSAATPSTPAADLGQALRGIWRIVSATGIEDVDRLSPVEFGELVGAAQLVGTGVCGFASDVAFPPAGGIDLIEVYWDAVICKDGDPADSRTALKAILEAVASGQVRADGTVILVGPAGEVVLAR